MVRKGSGVTQAKVQLRRAIVEDAAPISALIRSLSKAFVLDPDGSGADRFWASVSETAEASYIASTRYRYTVAVAGTELGGFIAMRDAGHVFHLFVAPPSQRQGLASRLWAHAREQAVQAGHGAAFTVNSSLAAVPVYERFGFVPAGEVIRADGIAFLPMQWAPARHPAITSTP